MDKLIAKTYLASNTNCSPILKAEIGNKGLEIKITITVEMYKCIGCSLNKSHVRHPFKNAISAVPTKHWKWFYQEEPQHTNIHADSEMGSTHMTWLCHPTRLVE